MHGGDDLPLVGLDAPMGEALLLMSQKGFGTVGVTDGDGALVGIVTDGDLRRNMTGLLDKTAGDVMTRDPKTIDPGELAEKAVALMDSLRITCLFAVARGGDGRAKGLITIHDCLRAGVV